MNSISREQIYYLNTLIQQENVHLKEKFESFSEAEEMLQVINKILKLNPAAKILKTDGRQLVVNDEIKFHNAIMDAIKQKSGASEQFESKKKDQPLRVTNISTLCKPTAEDDSAYSVSEIEGSEIEPDFFPKEGVEIDYQPLRV